MNETDWLSYRVGIWIRIQRRSLRWSQEHLGELMGIHRNRISRWETGTKGAMRLITLDDFMRLCDLFSLDPGKALLHIIREPQSKLRIKRPASEEDTCLSETKSDPSSEISLLNMNGLS